MLRPIIFWDWNGTLLNDVDICVESMNLLLSKRGMKQIDVDFYRSAFDFPVIEYYKILGFNFEKESFEKLSVDFISEYNSRSQQANLHTDVLEVLEVFRKSGRKQVIVSAMEQSMLEKQLAEKNIRHYFDEVCGLKDIYAHGKLSMALEYMQSDNINPEDVLFIGDTLHDAEVAHEIGCDSVLVTNGHHNHERLSVNGNKTIANLSELLKY
ncbi:MAG: HAD family hydrolase [Bacteroidales bacterium]|nr:HAD family hydrolase [Bacteroidales bacterium]MBN2818229.1 HAD family hydrolase [Bacteroidales bacterium]